MIGCGVEVQVVATPGALLTKLTRFKLALVAHSVSVFVDGSGALASTSRYVGSPRLAGERSKTLTAKEVCSRPGVTRRAFLYTLVVEQVMTVAAFPTSLTTKLLDAIMAVTDAAAAWKITHDFRKVLPAFAGDLGPTHSKVGTHNRVCFPTSEQFVVVT